jgi:hypothetical protein
MKPLFTLLTSLLVTLSFAQQKLIAVKGNATDAITTTLTDAIALAQPGDKIYLPGGYFSLTNPINKKVHIIGTGFQDGMNVTGKTTITGNIILESQADYSTFEGLYLSDWFINTSESNHITIKRCNMMGIAVNLGTRWNHSLIVNCVAREYLAFGENSYGTFGQQNIVTNSFIGQLYRAQHSTIKNCIISVHISECDNVMVENNIFGKSGDCILVSGSSNIIFNNNIINSLCFANHGVGIVAENSTMQFFTFNSLFVNATDFVFNTTSDFQLINTSEGNNAGLDGTDVGVFGGSNPWKIGSLPIIPNIEQNNSYLDVQNETFKLNVKVVPQTH